MDGIEFIRSVLSGDLEDGLGAPWMLRQEVCNLRRYEKAESSHMDSTSIVDLAVNDHPATVWSIVFRHCSKGQVLVFKGSEKENLLKQ